MNLAALLLFLASFAAASPASDSLKAVRSEIKSISLRPYEYEREARDFSVFWGLHVADTMRAVRAGEPRPYLSYDREERMYFDWRSRENARRGVGDPWWRLEDYERRKLFGEQLERERRTLDSVLADYATLPRRERYRDWLLASAPAPEASRILREARDLAAAGRRAEALTRLESVGADADFSPELVLARAALRMAAGDMKLPWDEWDRFYEALKARDPKGARRELSWEMLCRAEQSRSGDWKFSHSYGNPTAEEWDALVRAVGLKPGDADFAALRDYLKEHLAAAAAAAKAARGRPACGLVRVSASGGGDAATIAEGLAMLEPYGGRGVLLLAPGRYDEAVAVRGGRVVLRGPDATVTAPYGRPAVSVHGAEGFVLDGVALSARGANPFEIRASRGATLKRCALEAEAGRGLYSDGSAEVTVADCSTAVAP